MSRASRAPALLHSEECLAMPRQDRSSVIFKRRVNIIGLVVNLQENLHRASISPALLHCQEDHVMPGQEMSSLTSFNRRVDIFGVLALLRETTNRASISPTLLHSPKICAAPGQDISFIISFNRRFDAFGVVGVLREIANRASRVRMPTLQQICPMLGQDVASIVSFDRRVNTTGLLGVLREIVNGASRASALLHSQKICAIPGEDIFGSSPAPLVTRQCYFASLSSHSSHSLNIAEPETYCQSDLDRKTYESKMTLIDKGPINPFDIQSGVNDDDKLNGPQIDQKEENSQKVASSEVAFVGNLSGMKGNVVQQCANVPPDVHSADLVCGSIELERVAIKNKHEDGQSKTSRLENVQRNVTGYANGDNNCDLNGHVNDLADGNPVSDSEDEDYSWLYDRESQNDSSYDSESDHDWMYGSDSENDSMYQSDHESDLDQAEDDNFLGPVQQDEQDHPVNPQGHQPNYDLMPHWLPGYILYAHAVMNGALNPQGHQPDQGPPEEAPAGANPHHLPLHDAQDQPLVVENGNGEAQNELPANGADVNANGEDHDEGPPNGPEMPAMAQPALPVEGQHPQQGNQPQQQAQATGPLNKLRAAARYVKRKLTRNHNPVPMYLPGAPREERPPAGLEEAPALVGVPMAPHGDGDEMDEEAQPRGLFACFAFLFRRHGNPVQEYALQAEQVQEFEEHIPIVEPEIDVLEEDIPVVEELVEGAEQQIEAFVLPVEAF